MSARGSLLGLALVALLAVPGTAQQQELVPAPARRADEGKGPFKTFVIRGATLIDGSGAPATGPVDIVIQGNRIADIRGAGTPGVPMRSNRPPENADFELDATGMYVMPGFIDLHVHAGGPPKNAEAEYAYKLWLAHGVTTVRGVSLGPFDFSLSEQQRSARNEIVAPRIVNYQRPGSGWDRGGIDTPERGQPGARAAARRLASLLGAGPVVIVPVGRDVYGRTVADVYVAGWNVAEILRREGHQKPGR